MQNTTFRGGELRWMIEHEGLSVAPLSPLAFVLDSNPEGDLSAFRERGVTGDDWRTALAVLAQPVHQVRLLTPGMRSCRIAKFYAGAAGRPDELIGCWTENDLVRISFPWSPEAVAATSGQQLGAELPIPADPFSGTFSPAGLFLLMAATDAIREAQLAAMLDRRAAPGLRFTDADLQHELARGFSEDDARWSVTLLRLVCPPGLQPGSDPLMTGLSELAAVQLVRLDDGEWEPTETLLRLTAHWTPVLPVVAHEVVTLDDARAVRNYQHVITIRGDGPLWLVEFEGLVNGQARATLRSLNGAAYSAWLPTVIKLPPLPAAAKRPGTPGEPPPHSRTRPTTLPEAD